MAKHTGLASFLNRNWDERTRGNWVRHYRAHAYMLLVQVKERFSDNHISSNATEFTDSHFAVLRKMALADLAKARTKANNSWRIRPREELHQAQLALMGLRAFRDANRQLIINIQNMPERQQKVETP